MVEPVRQLNRELLAARPGAPARRTGATWSSSWRSPSACFTGWNPLVPRVPVFAGASTTRRGRDMGTGCPGGRPGARARRRARSVRSGLLRAGGVASVVGGRPTPPLVLTRRPSLRTGAPCEGRERGRRQRSPRPHAAGDRTAPHHGDQRTLARGQLRCSRTLGHDYQHGQERGRRRRSRG